MDPDDDGVLDKQWASNYILGPLYDPEPSQVFATRTARVKALPPTPPASASPTRPTFGSSRHGRAFSFSKSPPTNQDPDDQPFFRRVLSRSNSINKPLPPSPPQHTSPKLSHLERKRSLHTSRPPQTRWNQGTILSRSNSVASSRPSTEAVTSPTADKAKGHRVHRSASLAERFPGDRSHRPLEMLARDHMAKEDDDMPLRRGGSLRERYPGDMSHRPLAMIQRDHLAADRVPHLHNHRKKQPSDVIDSLDHTGPVPETYHHGGPYDPTMKSRNVDKKYSPVEAVRDTNMEAIKATPAAFLKDSLDKHVPLQGTAIVPPGKMDMTGRRMDYTEGADLMRERDAPGGAYKRWDHISYRDDDFKGKGEPHFTAERSQREKEKAKATMQKTGGLSSNDTASDLYYEMQPQSRTDNHNIKGADATQVRQRSVSNASARGEYREDPFSDDFAGAGSSSGVRRSNTTGKPNLAQSIKRKFGSLRRRKQEEKVY